MKTEPAPSGVGRHRIAGRSHVDTVLLVVSLGLVLIGYVMVTSASLHIGERVFGDSLYYPKHQLIHIAIGSLAGAVCAAMPLVVWERTGPWLFAAGIVLLVMMLIPGWGIEVNGSVVKYRNLISVFNTKKNAGGTSSTETYNF